MCLNYAQDELLWAAAWLFQATNNQYYLNYLGNNGDSMGGTGWGMTEFGWDVKYPGVQTLVAKVTDPLTGLFFLIKSTIVVHEI